MLEFLVVLILLIVAGVALFAVPFLRINIVSSLVLRIFRKLLPQISQTEQEALDAGTVWWEGALFSGKPDWNQLLAYPKPELTQKKKPFSMGRLNSYAPCSMNGTSPMNATICLPMSGSSSGKTAFSR